MSGITLSQLPILDSVSANNPKIVLLASDEMGTNTSYALPLGTIYNAFRTTYNTNNEILTLNLTAYGNIIAGSNLYSNVITTVLGSNHDITIDPDGTGNVIFPSSTELFVQSTVSSTSTSTGALVVSGGVGVSGNVYAANVIVGGTIDIFNYVNSTNTQLKAYTDGIVSSSNTQLKAYTDGIVTSSNTQLKAYTDGAIGSANTQLKAYTDGYIAYNNNLNTAQNTNITNANTQLKAYTDGAIDSANTQLKAYTDGQISYVSNVNTTQNTRLGTVESNTVYLFGAVNQANTNASNASYLSFGTIPSSILGNSTLYIGTTAITLNRASAGLVLTGITSIDGASPVANVTSYGAVNNAVTGTYYPDMSLGVSGNNATYANSSLSFNAATGTLTSGSFYSSNTAANNYFSGSVTVTGVIATNTSAPTIAATGNIAPIRLITFISGTAAPIANITPPVPIAAGGGQITLIPTATWTTNTAGNIALASTAVISKAMIMTWDNTTGKWYPSY